MTRKQIRSRRGERGPRRRQFSIEDSLTQRLYEGPQATPVGGGIGLVRVGGGRFAPLGYGATKIHPYKIVARLKDGRRFELRVDAISSREAIQQALEKFPLITIQKVSRADKIKTIGQFLGTAERFFEQ